MTTKKHTFTINDPIHKMLDDAQSAGLASYEFPPGLITNSPPVVIIVAIGEKNVALVKNRVFPIFDAEAVINKLLGKPS
jgi:hypothetical protein